MFWLRSPAVQHEPVDVVRTELWPRHPVVGAQLVVQLQAGLYAGVRSLAQAEHLPENNTEGPDIRLCCELAI